MPSPSVSSTEACAHRCVDLIEAYWAKRGHKVTVWIKPQTKFIEGRGANKGAWVTAMYAVYSDLVNGMPRKDGAATPGGAYVAPNKIDQNFRPYTDADVVFS